MIILFCSLFLILPLSAVTRNIEESIFIDAPVEQVWKKVTHFHEYPQWNPSIQSISGDCKKGSNIRIKCTSTSGRKWDLPVLITEVEKNTKLAWKGSAWGISGEQSFLLEKVSCSQCKFTITEQFSGWYLFIVWRLMKPSLATSFTNHCIALKNTCEKNTSH